MPLYIAPDNTIHSLDDPEDVAILPAGYREASVEEVTALLAVLNAPDPMLTVDEVSELRYVYFADTDWRLQRHREEGVLGIPTTHSDAQIMEVVRFRQGLRDIKSNPLYPSRDAIPEVPAFILAELGVMNEAR